MKKYEIAISSPPDREKIVAEISFDNVQWAEINQERQILAVEFYPRPDGEPWRIDYQDALGALEEAKRRLEDHGTTACSEQETYGSG